MKKVLFLVLTVAVLAPAAAFAEGEKKDGKDLNCDQLVTQVGQAIKTPAKANPDATDSTNTDPNATGAQ